MSIQTPIYITFALNLLTSIAKRWIYPRFGVVGVQAFLFVLALIGAAYWMYKEQVPGLEAVIGAAIALFSMAVAFYEVLLQHIPVLKGPPVE